MAAYGLGNTLLAAGQAEAAAETFMRACQLCSEHGLNELAPMAYTNLGVSLHRLGDFDQAFAALRVGSTFYRAQGNLPGEAFVCDNLALIYQELGRPDEAEKVWNYALGRYEGITNPAMADVREAGTGGHPGEAGAARGRQWRLIRDARRPDDRTRRGRRKCPGKGGGRASQRPTSGAIPPAAWGIRARPISCICRPATSARRRCRMFRARSRCRRAIWAGQWPRSARHRAHWRRPAPSSAR